MNNEIRTFKTAQDMAGAFPESVKSEAEREAWHNFGEYKEVRISDYPGNGQVFILCKPTTLYEWCLALTKWADFGVPILPVVGRPKEQELFYKFLDENPLRRQWWNTCNDLFPQEFEVEYYYQ